MLVALTANGEQFVCSSDLSRKQLKQQREQQQFFCPQCQEKVQLKIGEVKTPHFAHFANSQCEQLFSEGESELHLLGKQQLYHMFQRLQIQVELECYIKQLAQRPDLLVIDKYGKKYAIEFQCSPIPLERLRERTNGYITANITPIWLFLTPYQKISSATTIQRLSLSKMLQHVMRGDASSYQQYVITYNPLQQQFTYLSNLLYIHKYQWITKCLHLPISQQQFPFYEPAPLQRQDIQQYASIYQQYCQQYAQMKIWTSKQGVQDPFLRACYELRFSTKSLPYYIGIPMIHQKNISLFSVEWQVRLVYYSFLIQKGLQAFTAQDIVRALLWLQLPINPDTTSTLEQYITYFKEALSTPVGEAYTVERYLVNKLHSNREIEKI